MKNSEWLSKNSSGNLIFDFMLSLMSDCDGAQKKFCWKNLKTIFCSFDGQLNDSFVILTMMWMLED